MSLRLYYSAMDADDRTMVRICGMTSPVLGYIVQRSAQGKGYWILQPACKLGQRVRERLNGEKVQDRLNEFETLLEKCYSEEVGPPSPDGEKPGGLWFDPNIREDTLNGQKIREVDVCGYDINLGALIQRYETAGWSHWYYFAPDGYPFAEEMRKNVHNSANFAAIKQRARKAWELQTKSFFGGA